MPFKGNPVCLKCETNESPLWTNAENLGAVCLNCINEAKDDVKSDDEDEKGDECRNRRKTRSTRSYKTRLNPLAIPKTSTGKGRGRRAMFKKVPMKAPSATATPITSDYVFHNVGI